MKNILVVDDSVFMRMLVKDALISGGFSVEEAKNGREALEKCGAARYDCVVTDLLMPVLDGVGFLKAMQTEKRKTPVIVLTADIQQTTRTQCQELGAHSLLNKPPDAARLCEAVNRATAA